MTPAQPLAISNYCVGFLDLLGQKAALEGQTIVPAFQTAEQQDEFLRIAQSSVGNIAWLQDRASQFLEGYKKPADFVDQLNAEELAQYQEMKRARSIQQRWSDGLVVFHSLAAERWKCPTSAIAEIFHVSGLLCLLGMAENRPIRGAIETGWAIELHPGELSGAAVANAYTLESHVAQYPRIVVGKTTVDMLKSYLDEPVALGDKLQGFNKTVAGLCLSHTAVDSDGEVIVDYLGESFEQAVLLNERASLFDVGRRNVATQLAKHRQHQNEKLIGRYERLSEYYERNVR